MSLNDTTRRPLSGRWTLYSLRIALLMIALTGLLALPARVSAQVSVNYAFSTVSGTYNEISGGTVHGTAANDDQRFLNISLGFTFVFSGTPYTSISIDANGAIVMGGAISTTSLNLRTGPISNAIDNNVIAALGFDLRSTSGQGELMSKMEGTSPNRVFVVQWKNYRSYTSSESAADGDAFNFQVRLYETSNNIEVQYGTVTKNSLDRTPQIGLHGTGSADFSSRSVIAGTNTWATSAAATVNTATVAFTSALVPTSGLTYRWTYTPPPQVFQSMTALQSTGVATRGSSNIQILQIPISITGIINPLNATSFTFNTNGSTAPGVDIMNAKVYFTGSSNVFATTTQFGTVASPNGNFTVTGAQALATGQNYFWLVYDQTTTSTVGNILDAEFVSANVGGSSYSPVVGAPAGNRYIDYLDYATQIGSGTSVQRYPFGMYYGYERSASIYRGSEVGKGKINSIAWQMNSPGIVTGNVKIYLKRTTDVSTATMTWSNMIQGATLVYDGTPLLTSGLIRFGISPAFDFPNSNENLYVLVETNYGGGGGDASSTTKAVTYTTVEIGLHRLWEKDTNPPTTETGTPTTFRPNIQLSFIPPFTASFLGSTDFGNVGSEKRITPVITNSSPLYPLTVSNISLSGASSSYQLTLPGSTTSLPIPFTIASQQTKSFDIVFGKQGVSAAGQQNMTLALIHNGDNTPLPIAVTGYYASLTAKDGAINLLTPGAKLNVGGIQPGSGQLTKAFQLGSDVTLPVSSPIVISSYNLSGPDASLFQVSTLPTGVTGENIISVTLRAGGAQPGTKNATLVINHSGANGPTTTIQIEGRIGQPVIAAPAIVNLPPVAIGQVYNNQFENAALIPLTRAGAVDVQFFQTPTITGSGAGRMEIISNAGMFFVRGVYSPSGSVIVSGDGNINNPANWVNPILTPIQVTETQPLLLAVRMRTASAGTPAGSYDASILLANGTGGGVSNAVNAASVTLVGEVLDDPSILPFYPTQLAFGSTPIGTSTEKTLLVRNQSGVEGMAQLSITGIDYTFGNGARSISIALPADNTPVSVIVRFSPSSSGAANGVINASGVLSGSVALSGSGQAANPGNLQLLVDGQPLNGLVNFGNVAVGSTGMRMITVINNNVGPVEISSIGRSGANATQFSVGTPTTMTIAGNGGSVKFAVNFAPTSLSSPQKDATVTVYNSTGVPKSFNVRGTASTTSGNNVSVSLSPSQYNYGNASGSHSFVLTNTGTSPVVVSGALVLGSTNFVVEDMAGSFPRTIPAGGMTTVSVRFNAGDGVNGLRSASLLLVTPGVTPYPTSMLTGRVGSGVVHSGVSGVTGYEGTGEIELLGSYPNPSNGASELRYVLTSENAVRIRVYSESGAEVLRMDGGIQLQGEHHMNLELSEVSSGRYYYVVEAGSSRVSGSLIVQK